MHSNCASNTYYHINRIDIMNTTDRSGSSQAMVERKTLSIGTETYQRLKGFGKFGESFDDLFNRIMDEIEECRTEGKIKSERKK